MTDQERIAHINAALDECRGVIEQLADESAQLESALKAKTEECERLSVSVNTLNNMLERQAEALRVAREALETTQVQMWKGCRTAIEALSAIAKIGE